MGYKIILFGLTGFGSHMLQYLIDLDMEIVMLFTRQEKFEHPYFPVRFVEQIAEQHQIPSSFEVPQHVEDECDLIICASYHKMIPLNVLSRARLGAFNFHPSLLPSYRGATPTKCCLFKGEPETGMTIHKLTDKMDCGPLITQCRVSIEDYFDDGLLRQRLTLMQYPLLLDLFKFLETGETFPISETIKSSYYPPFMAPEVLYHPDISISELMRLAKACSPFPGFTLMVENNKIRISKFVSFSSEWFPASIQVEQNVITISGNDGILKMIGGDS